MKTVYKPWGKEEWLALNEKYCYKRIYLNKGTRTSFQYHQKKLETNYVIQGKAEVWLEDESGTIVKTIMTAGDFFTVVPPKKHRIVALTDLIMQEVSTPEVDDVVRIQDDSDRSSGKIDAEHKKPAMCILTAGMGNRLGEYTDYINKSLLPIDNKAVIGHIINKTPVDYDIVVALGYKSDQVRDYCLAAHPERNFKFIEVESFAPKTSGPATSLYACRDELQRPFYFCACDVFIEEDSLPQCSSNWLGLSRTVLSEMYATVELDESENAVKIKDKSESGFDYAWTGLMSIFDYKLFWENYNKDDLEIPDIIDKMIKKINFKSKFYEWYDLGTLDNYHKGKKIVEMSTGATQYVIPKVNGEFLFREGNRVIKINQSAQDTKDIIDRLALLSSNINVPNIVYGNNNLISYEWIPGRTLYDVDDASIYTGFLTYCEEKMWKKSYSLDNEKTIVQKFYVEKLRARVKLLRDTRNILTKSLEINGTKVESLDDQIEIIVSHVTDTHKSIFVEDFHGDFHFENILFDESVGYSFLDIRPNFGGQKEAGDVYYDLSKLYAGLVVDFNMLKDEQKFKVTNTGDDKVVLEAEENKSLKDFREKYEKWLLKNGYDIKSVKIIAASILIGIAGLHDVNQSNFLYYSGRRLLNER